MNKNLLLSLTVACSVTVLSGCALLVAGGAVTTAAVVADHRSTGTILDDRMIEGKASDFFGADGELSKQAHLNVTSYNGMALVVGQAPTEALRQRAVEYVTRVAKVRHVYNEVTVDAPLPGLNRTHDGLITTKVKGKLISISDINSNDITVTTENGVVYLMGFLDQPTGDAVGEAVAGVSGVQKVVKLFEAPQSPQAQSSK